MAEPIEEIAVELREALTEVMAWINNWDPNFAVYAAAHAVGGRAPWSLGGDDERR